MYADGERPKTFALSSMHVQDFRFVVEAAGSHVLENKYPVPWPLRCRIPRRDMEDL